MYLNVRGWSIRPKHVAFIDKTNKTCWGWRQVVCLFQYIFSSFAVR